MKFGLPAVVAVNRFPTDTEAEQGPLVRSKCAEAGANVALSEVWAKGGEGGLELAREVLRLTEEPQPFYHDVRDSLPLKEKIAAVVREIYNGDGVDFTPAASRELDKLEALGFGHLPVAWPKPSIPCPTQSRPAGLAVRVPGDGARRTAGGGCWVCGGADRRHHDHARAAEGSGGGSH